MSTMIAFSGAPGDCIYVEEDLDAVSLALGPDSPTVARLHQIPTQTDAFSPGEVVVNVARIAYARSN